MADASEKHLSFHEADREDGDRFIVEAREYIRADEILAWLSNPDTKLIVNEFKSQTVLTSE